MSHFAALALWRFCTWPTLQPTTTPHAAHSLDPNQSIVYCTAFAMAEKFTKICDLRPYMKGVNCVFMVLEKGMCVLSVWRCLRWMRMVSLARVSDGAAPPVAAAKVQ